MKSHYFEPQNARFAELSLHILDSAEDKKYRRRERQKAELLEEITAMEARRRQGQQEKNPTPHQLGATRRARPVRKTLARTQAASGCRAHEHTVPVKKGLYWRAEGIDTVFFVSFQ